MPTMINDPDSLKWGRLVKSWSTGLDYVTEGVDHPPPSSKLLPAELKLPELAPVPFNTGSSQGTIPGVASLTRAAFSALCKVAKIDAVNYPPKTAQVIIVQGDETTMVIRLPPTAVLQESERNLLKGGAYPTPSFYEPLFADPNGGPIPSANPPTTANKAGIMDLHANRIGDYTMGLCA